MGVGLRIRLPWLVGNHVLPCAGKVLGNLQLNLLSKSKVYEDPALSAIFLHNNYNYILKALEKYVAAGAALGSPASARPPGDGRAPWCPGGEGTPSPLAGPGPREVGGRPRRGCCEGQQPVGPPLSPLPPAPSPGPS